MPVNIKVIRTKDFIKTNATGILDLSASKQYLLDIASQIKQPNEYELLVDTREAESLLSTLDIFELGKALAEHPTLSRCKVCILAPKRDTDEAGFFETVAVNRGAHVRAFTDFEQAITWLVMEEAL